MRNTSHNTATMEALRTMLSILATTLLACSCDKTIHEYPDDGAVPVSVTLDLKYDTEMPLYQEVTYDTKASSNTIRYAINIYRANGDGSYGEEAYKSVTVEGSVADGLDKEVPLSLVPGSYRFIVWTDHNLYYDVGDFKEIMLGEDYVGNTDLRDAYRGTADAEVLAVEGAGQSCELLGDQVVTVNSERPLAKYKFITTDLDDFVTKVLRLREMAAQQAEGGESKASEESKAEDTKDGSKSIDLAEFQVKFRYTGFCPSSFNMFADKPTDSKVGVGFEGVITQTSTTEAELGFDYVFVNGQESSIPVALEVYDDSGNMMASTDPIEIPTKRGHLTIVSGDFLTSMAQGGVGIDADFEGDYNFKIQ